MKRIFGFFELIMLAVSGSAQDPIFLNTNQSLVYLNPSFAGSNGYIRDQASFRNQWPGQNGLYVTYANTFDAYIKAIKGGLAVSLMTDDQARGTFKRTSISLTYAQHISLMDGDLKIIPSLQASFGQERLVVDNLHFGDIFDQRYGMTWQDPTALPGSNKYFFDGSSGLLVNYKNFFAGISVFHFNQPDIGLLGPFKLPTLYSFNLSYNKAVSEKVLLNFSGRLVQQQSNTIGQGAITLVYKNLVAALGYQSQKTGFTYVGIRTEYFSAMFGYGLSFGKIYNVANSREIMLSFNLRKETPKGKLTNLENW